MQVDKPRAVFQVAAVDNSVLKSIPLEDCELLWKAYSEDPDSVGYFIDVGFRDEESAAISVKLWNSEMSRGEGLYLGIYVGSQLVGQIRSRKHSRLRSDSEQSCSLEYWLRPSFQRQGIMTHRIAVFLEFASSFFPQAAYFEIVCHPDNQRSIALARRVGFQEVRRERHLRETLPRLRLRRPVKAV